MRSGRLPEGGWCALSLVVALAGAGACLPVGHVDMEALRGCASAGDGAGIPGLDSLTCDRQPAVTLPLGSCMNAVMTVVAYRGRRPIARWRGEVKWTGALPRDGAYSGAVNRGRVAWDGEAPAGIRVETDARGGGGVSLRRWLLARAGRDGTGNHASGTRAGSSRGGARPSWSQPATAEVVSRGGRTPEPGGAAGGSPGGIGEPGDSGLAMGMPVFGGVVRVPASVAPALEAAALAADAGLSPTVLARKWIRLGLRLGVGRLRGRIAREAADHAARAVESVRARLRKSAAFTDLPDAEQRRILDAVDDAARREYFRRVEQGLAREIAATEASLAHPSVRAPRDAATRHNAGLLRENLASAKRVQQAVEQTRAALRPKARASRGTASAARSQARQIDYLLRRARHVRGRFPRNADPGEVLVRRTRQGASPTIRYMMSTVCRSDAST